MAAPKLYPLNDFAIRVTLQEVDPTDGTLGPLETGTVSWFLAISDSPTATAADVSLSGTATYTGDDGIWLILIDASLLVPATLATLFGSATPYLIFQQTSNVRGAVELEYVAERLVTAT